MNVAPTERGGNSLINGGNPDLPIEDESSTKLVEKRMSSSNWQVSQEVEVVCQKIDDTKVDYTNGNTVHSNNNEMENSPPKLIKPNQAKNNHNHVNNNNNNNNNNKETNFQRRQVKVKTCADVYDYWRTCKRLYKKAPKDGVEFEISYIDTGLGMDDESLRLAPIVLVLHGAPGSYQDFALLINHLAKDNKVRVIAPNFPLYTATVETKVLFRHSADEKAAYLRDFLKAIQVTKIDLLVSHSSAVFPTLLILLNANKPHHHLKGVGGQGQGQGQESPTHVISNNNKTYQSKEFSETTTKITSFHLSRHSLETNEDDDEDDGDEFFEDASEQIVDGNNNESKLIGKQQIEHLDLDQALPNLDQVQQQEQDDLSLSSRELHQVRENVNRIKSQHERRRRSKKKTRDQPAIVKFDSTFTLDIKAVALLNPAGHRLPKSMKPTWFKCGSVNIYQHKIGRYWFRKLGPAFLTVVGVPVKVDNMDNVMLSATVMRNSKCGRMVKQLEQLSQLQLPTLLVFSENDKLIEKEIFYEMTQFMGLDPKNFDIFNDQGTIERSQSRKGDWIRVMVFKAGGHYAYSNYAKTVNNAISELLEKVTSTSSTETTTTTTTTKISSTQTNNNDKATTTITTTTTTITTTDNLTDEELSKTTTTSTTTSQQQKSTINTNIFHATGDWVDQQPCLNGEVNNAIRDSHQQTSLMIPVMEK